MLQQAVFYVFAGLALFSASMVIISKNPVKAVLFLVLTFFTTAATWLILEAEFLAMILVLVYVGAVMVLFLFVVMMLDIDFATLKAKFTHYLPVGICVPVLLILLVYKVGSDDFGHEAFRSVVSFSGEVSNVRQLGELLYTQHLFHLEIAGLLLLVAMVSAICLAFRGPQARKTQKAHEQVQVKKADRLKIVKMESAPQTKENVT